MGTPAKPGPALVTAAPSEADLDAVAKEAEVKEATAPKPPTAQAVGPSLDSDKKDSLGNEKDGVAVGPRGADLPPDVMTDADKQKVADAHEARLSKNMSSTDGKSSTGTPKGSFQTTAQGVNLHGMKIPDKIDYSKPVEAPPAQVGPRGVGAPQDTYHGAKPPKKD